MASVVIHVDIDIDKIKAKLDRANKELTKNVAKDTESKFLPWLNGTLAARTRILDDEIIYPGPYAHFPDGTFRTPVRDLHVPSGRRNPAAPV